MEREKGQGEDWYRFTWHDRKAWWQQEQAILAYLILSGILGDDEYRKEARYAAAFYNAFFLDHDAGAVYFNVLASGMPYLLGTERLKGSHSMSAYHNTELCYLAAVYTNLLITKQPLDLHFKPRADAWKDRILRVSPDILPPGSIKIDQVWIDGQPWSEFDADKLTVTLPPPAGKDLAVKVRVISALETFESEVQVSDGTASVTLIRQARRDGDGDARARPRAGARERPAARRAARRAPRLDVERGRAGAALPAAEAAVRGRRRRDRRREAGGAGGLPARRRRASSRSCSSTTSRSSSRSSRASLSRREGSGSSPGPASTVRELLAGVPIGRQAGAGLAFAHDLSLSSRATERSTCHQRPGGDPRHPGP